MIGLPGRLGDHSVLPFGKDPAVGRISVRVKGRVLAIGRRELVPQLPHAFSAAIADMKRKRLAAAGVQGQPEPLLMGLFTPKAAPFVGFRLQGINEERIAALRHRNVKMGGCCPIALDSESPSATSCPPPTARQMPRNESRSLNRRSISARCSPEIRRCANARTNGRPQALQRWF